jgi:hypothetical protein
MARAPALAKAISRGGRAPSVVAAAQLFVARAALLLLEAPLDAAAASARGTGAFAGLSLCLGPFPQIASVKSQVEL